MKVFQWERVGESGRAGESGREKGPLMPATFISGFLFFVSLGGSLQSGVRERQART